MPSGRVTQSRVRCAERPGTIVIDSQGLLDPAVEQALESGSARLERFSGPGIETVQVAIDGQTGVAWSLVVDCPDGASLATGTCSGSGQLMGLLDNQFVHWVTGPSDLAVHTP